MHRFLYRSCYNNELTSGHWGEVSTRKNKYTPFSRCPYCESPLKYLEPYVESGANRGTVEPQFCVNCGWWTLVATFVDESHMYEWSSQSMAELVKYDIGGLETPTDLLVEYLASHFSDVYNISPRKLEIIVGAIFKDHLDCSVELTVATRDGGKDLLCVDAQNKKFVVEVKRYASTRKVGIGIIQRFAGVLLTEGISKGIIVTTSDFTRPARKARELIYKNTEETLCLELKAENDLLAWLKALNQDYRVERGAESASFVSLSLPPYCVLPESLVIAVMGETTL